MPSIKCTLLIALSCLLFSCNNTIVYNNLDWLAEWVIDDYVGLNAQQERLLQERLDETHSWHRNQELAKYRDQLIQLSLQLETPPLSYQEILQHIILIESHTQRLSRQISIEISDIAPLLSNVQIEKVFIELNIQNSKKLAEYQHKGETDFKQQRIEKIEQQLDKYLGSITAEQKLLVKVFVHNAHPMQKAYRDYLTRYLSALQRSFLNEKGQPLSKKIEALLIDRDNYKGDAYIQNAKDNRNLAIDTIYSINHILTPQQIVHLQNEISILIELIDNLTNEL